VLLASFSSRFSADYRPRCNFELELVGRLVSLLRRLRRAAAIESGLLNIQKHPSWKQSERKLGDRLKVFYDYIPALTPAADRLASQEQHDTESNEDTERCQAFQPEKLGCGDTAVAQTFLQLLRINGKVF